MRLVLTWLAWLAFRGMARFAEHFPDFHDWEGQPDD